MNDAALPRIVPRITTARLALRQLQVADFESYAAFMADADAMRFMSGPVDRRAAWRALASMTGAWLLTGAGWWGMELLATGELVGAVGAFFRETSLPISPDSDLEVGWTVFPAFARKGFATEGARAALASGFARHDVRRAVAQVSAGNVASIGVARAIGMTFDAEVDFYGAPILRYVTARPARS